MNKAVFFLTCVLVSLNLWCKAAILPLPPDSCITPIHHLCTQPVIPNIICPQFCIEQPYTVVSAHALFDCSLTLMGECVRYIALPGFIATDYVQVVACNDTQCDTATLVINVVASPNLCTPTPPPPCEVSPNQVCTNWNEMTTICPEFCLPDVYSLAAVSSLHPSLVSLLSNNCFAYTATAESVSWDLVTVVGCTGAGLCDTLQIQITLGDCTQPPPVSPDIVCTGVFNPIDLCFNMEAGEVFSATEVATTFQCSITAFAQSCITYYPPPGFSGIDTVSIPICQLSNPSNCRIQRFVVFVGCEQLVSVHDLVYISEAWVSVNGSIIPNTNGYEGVLIAPWQNDLLPCAMPDSLTIVTPPQNGSLTLLPDNLLFYVPNTGFSGTELITLQYCTPCNTCTTGNLTIHVTAPQVISNTASVNNRGNEIIRAVWQNANSLQIYYPQTLSGSEAGFTLFTSQGQVVSQHYVASLPIHTTTLALNQTLPAGLYLLQMGLPNGGNYVVKLWKE
ncbi:MAG TPA: hypothetical protein PK715_05075 [Chitinophagales bacterium]|nr:hypothetical protein [Chitinophagales bacterium]